MSDTPRTDSAIDAPMDGPNGLNIVARLTDLCAKLERENAAQKKRLDEVANLGDVHIYPREWDCAGAGGPPPIEAYEKVDLAWFVSDPTADATAL